MMLQQRLGKGYRIGVQRLDSKVGHKLRLEMHTNRPLMLGTVHLLSQLHQDTGLGLVPYICHTGLQGT